MILRKTILSTVLLLAVVAAHPVFAAECAFAEFTEDGLSFEGTICDDGTAAHIKFSLDTGESFEGLAKDGKTPHGHGKLVNSDGTLIEGFFQDGDILQGIITRSDGHVEEGTFRDDELIEGRITYAEGSIREGSFRDEKLNGQGKIIYTDGGIREGTFRDEKLNGQGITIFANGQTQEGQFRDNKLNGEGRIKLNDNYTESGTFRDGNLVEGKITFGNQDYLRGTFRNKELSNGTFKTTEGSNVYTGRIEYGEIVNSSCYNETRNRTCGGRSKSQEIDDTANAIANLLSAIILAK